MAKYLNLAGLQTLWTKLKDTFALKKHSHTAADIPVDTALSSTSENPVQNKVVNSALDGKAEANGYYPDMSVGGADHSEVSASVKDYNDLSSIIKIGYAGSSLSSCTMLAAYTKLDGGTNAIKDIPANVVKVGKASKADNADVSTKANFSVNMADVNGGDSGIAVHDCVPFVRFIRGSRTPVVNVFPKAVSDAVSFSFTNAYCLVFWEIQIENVFSDGVLSFTLYDVSKSTKQKLSSSAVFVKSGNSSVMVVTTALLSGGGNKSLQLWIDDANQGGHQFFVTAKGTMIKMSSLL
ncbi:MAG: hypothetical protein MJY87_02360 [Fibrobacter sp.]|nr:hypothetical protein [Fibrobacter sp.]